MDDVVSRARQWLAHGRWRVPNGRSKVAAPAPKTAVFALGGRVGSIRAVWDQTARSHGGGGRGRHACNSLEGASSRSHAGSRGQERAQTLVGITIHVVIATVMRHEWRVGCEQRPRARHVERRTETCSGEVWMLSSSDVRVKQMQMQVQIHL
jgi:hypothetical protein